MFGDRPIKAFFRKQPWLATALTVGAVDGLMGSAEDKVSLALFGLLLAGGAVTVSWGQIQRHAASSKMPVMLHPPGQIYSPPSTGLKDLQANTGDESTP
ncbi:MAG TPA: hypothetical protein VEZ50_13875 [Nodosilinea sp.]|nr:hypothetical protein [Nodosilinea sp.]